MKENTQFLLEKAESVIGAAESLLRDRYRDFAAGARVLRHVLHC
jgi:hypothetical protein